MHFSPLGNAVLFSSSYLPPVYRTRTTHNDNSLASPPADSYKSPAISKKARDDSPVKSDSTSPETLSLSVLTWIGSPRTFNADREALDGYVGEYRSAHTPDWLLDGWDEGRQAFQYSPSPNAPLPSFPYSREAFTDTAGSSITYYGGIICHEMSPVARIGLPEDGLWTETYRKPWVEGESEGEPVQNEFDDYPQEAEVHPGPPFLFYECDFPDPDETPHRFFRDDTVLIIDQPDLPGQVEGGADTVEGEGPDSSRGVGWRGPWIDELIHLNEGGAPLGERTNTYEDQRELWAMVVNLRVVEIYETEFFEDTDGHDQELMGTNALRKYDVEATIHEIYVKPEWAHRNDVPEDVETEA